jgi:hypothetical protein
MRYKLIAPLVLSLSLLPLTAAASMLPPAGQPDALGFRILFSDGSILRGALSFTLDIDTQYGRLTISSANLLSARFHIDGQWADIYTRGNELRVRYDPASSDLRATTDAGPVNVDLTKVISIETLYAAVPSAAPPAASNPEYQGAPPAAPSDIYAETTAATVPYAYGPAAPPYVNPAYLAVQPYGYPYWYSYTWCPGYGFIPVANFNGNYYGRRGGFGGHFHGAAAGRAFPSSSFRSAASATFRSATPAFRSAGSVFRSGAARTFWSGATTTSHSGAAPSFRSGGMQSGNAGGRFR